MSYWILGGITLSVWALLSLVGSEAVRRQREASGQPSGPPAAVPDDGKGSH